MAKTARVLVVEDDRDNLGMITFMLKRMGYTVLEAHDGQEGVDMARKEMPDLILLDLAMPEMDGWTAAQILKSDPATQKIKIVVVSVRSLLEDRRRAQDAGVDGYITKPMSMSVFAEEVGRYLSPPESPEKNG